MKIGRTVRSLFVAVALALPAVTPAHASSVPNVNWSNVKCYKIPGMVQVLAAAAQTVVAEINEMLEDGASWVDIVAALGDLGAIQNEMLEGAQHYARGDCVH